MPINLEQIEAFFVEEGLKYRLADEGHLLTGFAMSNDRGPDGPKRSRKSRSDV
jgi:hypothetical protein